MREQARFSRRVQQALEPFANRVLAVRKLFELAEGRLTPGQRRRMFDFLIDPIVDDLDAAISEVLEDYA